MESSYGSGSGGRFGSGFLELAAGTCDPDKWRRHFSHYDPGEWAADGDGGSIWFSSDDGREMSMNIIHWEGLGFLLKYECRNQSANAPTWVKYSVGQSGRIDEFETRDDLTFPVGCFLDPDTAGSVISDFFQQPMEPSASVQWVDSGDIPWPDYMM